MLGLIDIVQKSTFFIAISPLDSKWKEDDLFVATVNKFHKPQQLQGPMKYTQGDW